MKIKVITVLMCILIFSGCWKNDINNNSVNINTNDTNDINTTSTTIPTVKSTNNLMFNPLLPTQLYGYNLLLKESNKDMAKAYQRIVVAVENVDTYADLKDLTLNKDEIGRIFYYYIHDYPEHFYRKNEYQYEYMKNGNYSKIVRLRLKYEFDGDKSRIEAAKQVFNERIQAYLNGISSSMSDFEKELLIHDRLVKNVEYDLTLSKAHIHNTYGPIVNGYAVCEGYARAFQYLLKQVGIPSIFVSGQAINDKEQIMSHAWNLVRLDKEYYHVDVTWDDTVIANKDKDLVMYYYFNLNDDQIFANHFVLAEMNEENTYQFSVPIPEAKGTKYNYFEYKNLKLSSLSVDGIANLIIKAANNKTKYAHFKTSTKSSEVNKFISNNFYAIQEKVNRAVSSEYKMSKQLEFYSSMNVVVLKFA